ncbi:hypothetical protein PSYMO_12547 [Pseudomonas amygdali pv. mori str. 301020]|uniref:Uncharacterized protein n=1 Tax=Pseudomonas amygdali pv. mori str. 301020 TaxID=629261 RepID=A0A656G974_PSEA0|nr:hypothetical protein PSYMO_12547 [Pseudomonas amygdali pv. mori str. 301020]
MRGLCVTVVFVKVLFVKVLFVKVRWASTLYFFAVIQVFLKGDRSALQRVFLRCPEALKTTMTMRKRAIERASAPVRVESVQAA